MSEGERRNGRTGRRVAIGAGFVVFLLLGLLAASRIGSHGLAFRTPSPEKQLIGSWELLGEEDAGSVFTFRRDGVAIIEDDDIRRVARYWVEENEMVVEYHEGGNNPVRTRIPFSIEGDEMTATENGKTARLRRVRR